MIEREKPYRTGPMVRGLSYAVVQIAEDTYPASARSRGNLVPAANQMGPAC